MAEQETYDVHLRQPHPKQQEFLDSSAKRVVVRAGRRGGKTTGMAIRAVEAFLDGRRVLYAAPTEDQISAFWWEVKRALAEPLDAGVLTKNETRHIIEREGTKQRIRAKTAWNADTLRGDYCDLLIIDEWQLLDEDAWRLVGAPMLLDNDGDAVFVYTPPSLQSRSVSKARDPRHAAKLFKRAAADPSGRWEAFHFTSHDNPHISRQALEDLSGDMTAHAIRQEIGAEDLDEVPGAVFSRAHIRHEAAAVGSLARVVVGVDPAASSSATSAETGIVVAGVDENGTAHVLDDLSLRGSPERWGARVADAYHGYEADRVVAEKNQGGEMVGAVLRVADPTVPLKLVHASRGKRVRAEPVAALYERGRVLHDTQANLAVLEDQMVSYVPEESGGLLDRVDALVYAVTDLVLPTARNVRKARVFSF